MIEIPKPDISPDFTLEDIRKIREWNSERYKSMTPQEIVEDTRKGAEEFLALLRKPVDPDRQAEINRLLQSVWQTEIKPK